MPPAVHLRPVTLADIPTLYQFQLDPESNDLAAVNPRDLPTFEAIWTKILTEPGSRVIPRAIIADGVLVGSINIFQREGQDFVGYWIDRPHWGKGIASRALALLLAEPTPRPLHAQAARHNPASIRVLTRNGFTITRYEHGPASERFRECEVAVLILE